MRAIFRMNPFLKIALLALTLFALAGIMAGVYLFFEKPANLAFVKPDYIVTATSLQKEFEENEQGASAKYINKTLEVTGSVLAISQSDSSNLNISLKTGNDISSVICTFASADPSKFKTGEEITLRGVCSGYLMDVLLNNCAVVPKRK